jgi:hypothetical protein
MRNILFVARIEKAGAKALVFPDFLVGLKPHANPKCIKEPLIKSGFVKGTASAVPQVVFLQCGFSR